MSAEGILSDVKVLEIAHAASGAFCAKLLADQGADTIKVEPPGRGDEARHEPPFIDGEPHPDRSTTFLALNTNKRSVTLNLEDAEERALFLKLALDADVVIESFQPGRLAELGLGYDVLRARNPKAILLSISYFGQAGPYAHYKGDDLIAQAMGGFLYAVTGTADKPPMGTALQQMELTAGRNGAIAIMAALLARDESGEGTHIDLSVMEAAIATPSMLIQNYSYLGKSPRRGAFDKFVMDGMHLPTKDGEVTLTTAGTGGRPMEVWAEFLGEPRLLDPKFATRASRNDNWEELRDLVAPKLKEWNNLDLMRETMARGLVIGLVQSPTQVVESPHLEARGHFVELEHPEVGTLKYPGPGFMLDGVNPMQTTRAAPRLGEHNEEILGIKGEIAPTGKFRVGMNGNNATLTIRSADGTLAGLSIDLGHFIAGKLGVPVEPVFYASSSPFTKSFGSNDWDIIITGKNAVVAKLVEFSADLFSIEYVYLAAPGREFADVSAVDRPGVRIAVPRNASADVYLSKALQSAELVRLDGDANDAIELLRAGKADVYGSNINTLRAMAERLPGSKILGTFNVVTFSVAMRPGLSAAARAKLTGWVEEAKAAGIVQKALEQAGAEGVRVAP